MMNLDALVAPLRADVVSGASVVTRTACEVYRRAAVRIEASATGEVRARLGELAVKILDAQPAMAPLVALARAVLDAVEDAGSVEDGKRLAARAAEDFRAGIERRTRAVGRRAAELLPGEGTVLTLSSSSSVRAALLHRPASPDLRVVCLEARPMNEGRALARALAEKGVPVTVAVDAAAASLLDGVDAVVFGADSVGDAGLVNKIGSALLAREAARREIPVVVPADTAKLLPPGFPQPVDDDRPADEVWQAPAGVRVWNRYFEIVPLGLVHRLVTEEEALPPERVEARRRSLSVPPELRAWADAQRTAPERPGPGPREGAGGEEPPPASSV